MSLTSTVSEFCGAGGEHVGGDMFESVPTGDAIFMKVSTPTSK